MRLHVAISLFYKCKADDEECMHTNERKSDENSFFTFQMLDNFIISRSDNILTIVAFKNAFFSLKYIPREHARIVLRFNITMCELDDEFENDCGK